MFEDNPTKVAAAARAVRQRDQLRKRGPKNQASPDLYDVQVQEARSLLAAGKLEDAERGARSAMRLNVVPPVTADRAESVLHDIDMARARGVVDSSVNVAAGPAPGNPAARAFPVQGAAAATNPANPPPSVLAEKEANALLDQNQQEAAKRNSPKRSSYASKRLA